MVQAETADLSNSERHFAGSMTQYLVHYLQNHVAAGSLEEVLRLADETRGPEVLCDEAGWSTYAQFRTL